jgi:copper chaperone CopZ
VATIERELAEVPGVEKVQASLDSKQVTVHFDDETVPSRVEDALTEIGYPAVV